MSAARHSGKAGRKNAASAAAAANAFDLRGLKDALPAEAPEDDAPAIPSEPFRLLDLPLELRLKIYEYYLFTPREKRLPRHIITRSALTAYNLQSERVAIIPSCGFFKGRSALLTSCTQVHAEVAWLLYATQSFRIFATQDNDHKPTVDRIPGRYKPLVRTAELVFGPSWTNPGGKVTGRLGLGALVGVRRLKVYVECDPSHPIFEGFRVSRGFYTEYAEGLFVKVLAGLPGVEVVEFDGGGLVEKEGPLMRRLHAVAWEGGVKVEYGPLKRWGFERPNLNKEVMVDEGYDEDESDEIENDLADDLDEVFS